jgi:hypothetical protein
MPRIVEFLHNSVFEVTVVNWLVDFFTTCFMDQLINFMNNNHSFPLSLFHFLLITNPLAFPYSFFNPCSKIDYNQENFGVKAVGSGNVLFGLQ